MEGSVGGKSGGHSAGCVAEWLCVGAVRCRAVSSFMLSSDKKVMGDGAAYAPLFRQIYSFFLSEASLLPFFAMICVIFLLYSYEYAYFVDCSEQYCVTFGGAFCLFYV